MKDPMEGNLIDPQLMDWSFFSSENSFFLFASRISQRGAKKTIVEWRDLLKWDQESCRLLFFPYCWIEDKKRIHWSSLLRKLRIDGSLLFVGAVLVSTTWAHRLYVVHLWVGSSRTLYTINKKAHTIFLYHIVCVCFFFLIHSFIYTFFSYSDPSSTCHHAGALHPISHTAGRKTRSEREKKKWSLRTKLNRATDVWPSHAGGIWEK